MLHTFSDTRVAMVTERIIIVAGDSIIWMR